METLVGSIFLAALTIMGVEPRYKIAIIDTGYSYDIFQGERLKLCDSGHYDFVAGAPVISTGTGHGSKVAAIIANRLKNVDYCAVIYNVEAKPGYIPSALVSKAFLRVSSQRFTAVTVSFSGTVPSPGEKMAMELAVESGAKIFVAAGNMSKDLDQICNVYPACYPIPKMKVVGAVGDDYTLPADYSNYGSRIDIWALGSYDQVDYGTSYAVPRALASYVRSLERFPF